MSDQAASALPVPAQLPPGAENGISADEYMARYAHDHYEWAQGVLVEMTPVNIRHDELAAYLMDVFRAYFALRPSGVVLREPFVMRLDVVEAWREPDLQIILKGNSDNLTDTAMIGPADICVEIVSPESVARDYGQKFAEYEKAGVREYWLVDPTRETALFYHLNEEGVYKLMAPGEKGAYQTTLLPGFELHVPTLWKQELPDIMAIVETVRVMLGNTSG